MQSKIPLAGTIPSNILSRMSVTSDLASRLRRLTPRQKVVLADHLWREAEAKIGPTAAQVSLLNERAAEALRTPSRLKPAGDAVRRLRR